MKNKIDIVITRHEALVAYLRERLLIEEQTPVIAHASVSDVKGKHVLGVLPHHLSQHTASITEIPMALTKEDREAMQRGDLSLERVREVAGDPVTYRVFGGYDVTSQVERAAGLPQQRLQASAYKHLAQMETGWRIVNGCRVPMDPWGSGYSVGDSRELRAVKAARGWIPYDLMGPGSWDGVTQRDIDDGTGEPTIGGGVSGPLFGDRDTVMYTAGDAHVWSEAHRGGYVRFGIMNESTQWIDIETMEPATEILSA